MLYLLPSLFVCRKNASVPGCSTTPWYAGNLTINGDTAVMQPGQMYNQWQNPSFIVKKGAWNVRKTIIFSKEYFSIKHIGTVTLDCYRDLHKMRNPKQAILHRTLWSVEGRHKTALEIHISLVLRSFRSSNYSVLCRSHTGPRLLCTSNINQVLKRQTRDRDKTHLRSVNLEEQKMLPAAHCSQMITVDRQIFK